MTGVPASATVASVLAHADRRPATLGAGRLVCIDGPAGAGKTTLAAALAQVRAARVVHMDDLYEGWTGLPDVDAQLVRLLGPMVHGRPGGYRRWDWERGAWAGWVTVPAVDLLVLEGVGAGSRSIAELITTLVFVDAPPELRMRRGLARDGEAFAPHWTAWAEAEQARFAADRTRERADLVVTGCAPHDPG